MVANRDDVSLSVLIGRGDGTFEDQIVFPGWGAPHDMQLADLDGNGLRDVVVAMWGGNMVGVYVNQGNAVLSGPTLYPTQQYPFGLDIADFNEDDIPDGAISSIVIQALG